VCLASRHGVKRCLLTGIPVTRIFVEFNASWTSTRYKDAKASKLSVSLTRYTLGDEFALAIIALFPFWSRR